MTDTTATLADLDQPAPASAAETGDLRSLAAKISDPDERAGAAVRAVRDMVTAGADEAALASARAYALRTKLLPARTFDQVARDAQRDLTQEQGSPETANQATALVELARQHYRMVRSEDGKAYAVELAGPNVAISLGRSGQFSSHLVRLYLEESGQAPSDQAERMAVKILRAYLAEQEPETVHLRYAQHESTIVQDLATADGRCVIVEASGWRIENRSPVLFRRGVGSPLPDPVRGDDGLKQLSGLVNVNETQFRLGVAWLVAALIPGVPHPILVPRGEQGSAKTTLARIFQRLIDPSGLEPGSLPGDERDFAVRMNAAYVQAFDNASIIPPWESDALCRATTGGTYAARALYSDDDLSILQYLRCIILTTIDAGALNGDLIERMLPLDLDQIKAGNRKVERTAIGDSADDKPGLFDELDRARPAIMASLLDLLAAVLKHITEVELTDLPRMADFGKILAALDKAQGWKTFDLYTELVDNETGALVEGSPFAARLVEYMYNREQWSGTATALRDVLTAMLPDKDHPPKGWPADATRAGGLLKRMAPSLRVHGIEIEYGLEGKRSTRTYKVGKTASAASAASAAMSDQEEQADAEADASALADAASVGQPHGGQNRPTLPTLADAEILASVGHENAGQRQSADAADAADASSYKRTEPAAHNVTDGNHREAQVSGCCAGCGEPLDPANIAAGFTTHGGACDAVARAKTPTQDQLKEAGTWQ
jgi:hypothetical protein